MNRSNRFFLFMFSMAFVQNCSLIFGHPVHAPSRVNTINTEDSLHAALTGQMATVIMGSMDNCPHCSHLSPFFEQLASQYPSVDFVKVNGPKLNMHQHVSRLTQGKMTIPGYPTILAIYHGKIISMVIGGDKKKLKSMLEQLREKMNA